MSELLRDHTTLRLGGPAGRFVVAATEEELIDAVRAGGGKLISVAARRQSLEDVYLREVAGR